RSKRDWSSDVCSSDLDRDHGGGQAVPGISFIVMDDRLPTAVVAILAGTAFGLSGTIFQTLLRNPLASPDVIGVTLGASAGAVIRSEERRVGATGAVRR